MFNEEFRKKCKPCNVGEKYKEDAEKVMKGTEESMEDLFEKAKPKKQNGLFF